ncbi:MAG TPA: hypothetical protein VFB50_12745, partial [Chloroflexota bacterium]|nr:hypothetical protein [Chloroflexota bacterium]
VAKESDRASLSALEGAARLLTKASTFEEAKLIRDIADPSASTGVTAVARLRPAGGAVAGRLRAQPGSVKSRPRPMFRSQRRECVLAFGWLAHRIARADAKCLGQLVRDSELQRLAGLACDER